MSPFPRRPFTDAVFVFQNKKPSPRLPLLYLTSDVSLLLLLIISLPATDIRFGKRCVIKTQSQEVFKKYTGIFAVSTKGVLGWELYEKVE